LVGVEVHDHVNTSNLTKNLIDNGLLTKETRNRTFRLTPPIVIEDSLIDAIVERIGKSLAAL
ncbi:MAG: hypothetical protein JNM34_07985, partial [Chthonomonadaceae bacterium]|nr:hypothetical protein [Chthonomonadaceae bacterium]